MMESWKPLLNAVNPRDKLESGAGWSVALDVGFWSTVDCVEDHQSILSATILKKERDHQM